MKKIDLTVLIQRIRKIPAAWLWVLGFVILGILIATCLVGYSFSALVCFGIAGIIVCYLLLRKLAVKRPRPAKIIRGILTACICIGLVAAAITGGFVLDASFGDQDMEFDYLVVLGCGVHGTRPSLSLQNRINAAYAYLQDHPDVICVVSGGQGPDEDISEALCMYQELKAMGIAENRIWMEDKSTSTRENLRFSLAVIREKTATTPDHIGVLSSEYHLLRAKMLASEQGVTAWGVPAKTSRFSLFVNYFLREIVSVWYYGTIGRG